MRGEDGDVLCGSTCRDDKDEAAASDDDNGEDDSSEVVGGMGGDNVPVTFGEVLDWGTAEETETEKRKNSRQILGFAIMGLMCTATVSFNILPRVFL